MNYKLLRSYIITTQLQLQAHRWNVRGYNVIAEIAVYKCIINNYIRYNKIINNNLYINIFFNVYMQPEVFIRIYIFIISYYILPIIYAWYKYTYMYGRTVLYYIETGTYTLYNLLPAYTLIKLILITKCKFKF